MAFFLSTTGPALALSVGDEYLLSYLAASSRADSDMLSGLELLDEPGDDDDSLPRRENTLDGDGRFSEAKVNKKSV